MKDFEISIDEVNDDFIYSASHKICTQIAKDTDEATFKAIQRYCEENDIMPNIISEDKLKLVLQLGIAELNKRDLVEKIDEQNVSN